MNYWRKLLPVTAVVLFSACNPVHFDPTQSASIDKSADDTAEEPAAVATPLPDTPTVDVPSAPVCAPGQVEINRPMRVLFVVDQSGSNLNGPYEAPGEATDPLKTFRLKVMEDFYSANQLKSNLSWGLTVFNNDAAANLMKNAAQQTIPFSSLAVDFSASINRFKVRTDVGSTPYKAGLQLAKQTITNDLLTAPAHVGYLIVFLTDGYPTDYCPDGSYSLGCPGQVLESQIDSDIRAITALAPGTIQFSTVYYGKPDSEAATRLRRMATVGEGEFVNTNETSEVKLNDILEVDQVICAEK